MSGRRVAASSALLLATASFAGESRPDKSGYHLLHPVPREQMRELSTDRPDQTESAYTVDAGHFQVESDLVAYTRATLDLPGGIRQREQTWTFGGLNIKAGLLPSVDLQVLLTPHERYLLDSTDPAIRDRADGFGDMETRLKWNVWGNDGGKTALALMPYVRWSTSEIQPGRGVAEAGVIVPMAVELPSGWGLGLQTGPQVSRSVGGSVEDLSWMNSATLGHDIVGPLAGYLEFFSVAPVSMAGDWDGWVDVGFTLGLTPDVQADFGCNFGVHGDAPEYGPFVGLSVRF
jgi:hypothetical protein